MSIAFCKLLQKNWRFRDENGAVLDQLQLLFPGEPLDGPFPPEGGGAVRRLLTVDQDHRHGGWFEVVSREGVGTRISFLLPSAPASTEEEAL